MAKKLIESTVPFTKAGYEKLMASGKFTATPWGVSRMAIIEAGRTSVIGKYNTMDNYVYIHGDKTEGNALVKWLMENGFLSDNNFMAKGGKIANKVSGVIEKLAKKHNGTVNYIVAKGGSVNLDFNFPTPEDAKNFSDELQAFNDGTLKLKTGGSIKKKIGSTKSGKDVFDQLDDSYTSFTANDHSDARAIHRSLWGSLYRKSNGSKSDERKMDNHKKLGDWHDEQETLSYKGENNMKYKKGDIVYVFQHHSDPRKSEYANTPEERAEYDAIPSKYVVGKKGAQQKWSKVEILEPWSTERGWETYKVKQLDGYRKEDLFVANQSQMSTTNGDRIAIGYMEKGGAITHNSKEPVNKKVYAAMLDEAKENKAWAEKTKNDKAWIKNASGMSKEMLNEYLTKSIDDMAMSSYKYLKMRAHAIGSHKGHIDQAAKEKWESLSGSEIKMETGGNISGFEYSIGGL